MAARRPLAMVSRHDLRHDARPPLRSQLARPPDGVMLSPADFDRGGSRTGLAPRHAPRRLAERLRDARAFGTAVDDDDHVAVLEDTAVERMKIAQLERLVASATVIDGAVDVPGAAGLGSVVRVRDDGGQGGRVRTRRPPGGRRNANPGHAGVAGRRGAARLARRRRRARDASERARADPHGAGRDRR